MTSSKWDHAIRSFRDGAGRARFFHWWGHLFAPAPATGLMEAGYKRDQPL